MRNLKVTALVAAALVSGLVLAGIGTAMAVSRVASTPTTVQTLSGSTDATAEIVPVSDDATLVVAPPSDDTTPSVTTTATPRPPMPPKSRGHAYGRVISHPHSGLHFGWAHKPASSTHRAQHMNANVNSAHTTPRGNSGHMSGSMMGR